MSVPDPAAAGEQRDDAGEQPDERDDARAEELPEPQVTRTEVVVGLQRSVRYGPIMIGFAVLGAVVLAIAAIFFPVTENAQYSLGQIAGFMAMIGGALGLLVGGAVSLVLGLVARRQRGSAVAVQTDVR